MKNFRITLLFMFGLIPAAGAETLLEVYRQAEASDPQFKIAEAEQLAAREQVPQARSLLLPNVGLSGSAIAQRGQGRSTDATTLGYSVSVTQPLFQRDAQIQNDQADKQVEKAEVDYEYARQELILRVAQRYFEVLSALDELEFARTNKAAIHRQLDQSQQRFEVGLIAITDVHESQARYDLANAEEISAENELSTAREALREVAGQYYDSLAGLGDGIEFAPPDPASIEHWTERALEQNPALLALQFDAQIAAQEVHRQRAARLPEIDLVGRHSYSDSDTDDSFSGGYSHTNSLGVQFSMPLYVGGAISSRTREAKIRHQQALDSIELQRRQIERQVRDAYLGILAGISRVTALQQAVVSSQSAYEATRTGFEVGTRTSVEVLNSQRDLLAAKRDYANSRYHYVLNTLILKRAVGTLKVTDLEALEAWFE